MSETSIERAVRTEEETLALGEAIGKLCAPGDVVELTGELGAGKTRFVRGVARGMGIDPAQVHSPTYVLLHEYAPIDEGGVTLLHLDAYRMGGSDELDALGLDEAGLRACVLAVEWPGRVEGGDAWGEDALRITIDHAGETSRRVTLEGGGAWAGRLASLGE